MSKLKMRRAPHAADESPEETTVVDERAADDDAGEPIADAAAADDDTQAADVNEDADTGDQSPALPTSRRSINWTRVLAYGVLPGLALVLAMTAGLLKWLDSSVGDSELASIESVQVAKDSTIALLSYKPDTVERDLTAARDRLTGDFRDSYTQLTNDVVIPGAKQQQITAAATVPAVASVSADPNHAVVLVFVNQTTTIGQDRPSDSASSVRVTLDKVGDRWLVSGFDPV